MKTQSRGTFKRIAYFITPHGFGHAARAAAIMKAIHRCNPQVHFDLYTLVPPWFFQESVAGIFTYHEALTDIGLVQTSPLEENIPATIKRLQDFFPFSDQTINPLKNELQLSGCQIVLCDISPLGIVAAQRAGIPSVLVENFTWDWIYEPYVQDYPQFSEIISTLKQYFHSATYHIQSLPICNREKSCNLITAPISRPADHNRALVRQQLALTETDKVLLISMGGIQQKFQFLEKLKSIPEYQFIIPGGSRTSEKKDNLILLPFQSSHYHPDLLHASDAVIGKVGYSTLAETYHAGIPFGYIARSNFRESHSLTNFIRNEMSGIQIPGGAFQTGSWTEIIPELINLPKFKRDGTNGADQTAMFISSQLWP